MIQDGLTQLGVNAPFASNVASVVWSIALPIAIGAGSAYMGWKEYKKQWGVKWAYNGIEKSALLYGWLGAIGWGIGLLSAPFVAPVLAGWLGMYGVKKLAKAANENVSKINPMNLLDKGAKDIDKAA